MTKSLKDENCQFLQMVFWSKNPGSVKSTTKIELNQKPAHGQLEKSHKPGVTIFSMETWAQTTTRFLPHPVPQKKTSLEPSVQRGSTDEKRYG